MNVHAFNLLHNDYLLVFERLREKAARKRNMQLHNINALPKQLGIDKIDTQNLDTLRTDMTMRL